MTGFKYIVIQASSNGFKRFANNREQKYSAMRKIFHPWLLT